MHILYYTVAVGQHMEELQRRLQPAFVQVLTAEMLGLEKDSDPLRIFQSRCRLPEFFDISKYDAIVQLEADVSFNTPVAVPLDRITVERGDNTFAYYLADYPYLIPPVGPMTWQGFLSIPGGVAVQFFDQWRENYKQIGNKPFEELITYETLKPFKWSFRNDIAFYPQEAAIIHYRGLAAKRSVYPDFSDNF